MILIAGLGNPGDRYMRTKHNMGFDVLDALARHMGISFKSSRFKAVTAEGFIGGTKVMLMKPLTYMNLSGDAVAPALDYYGIDPEEGLIVISDDIALQPGRLRIRKKGSSGGQKGLADIIRRVGTDNFTRVRVGIGDKPEGWELADWVLSTFDKSDREAVDIAIDKAADACELIVREGADAAMNRYNANE